MKPDAMDFAILLALFVLIGAGICLLAKVAQLFFGGAA